VSPRAFYSVFLRRLAIVAQVSAFAFGFGAGVGFSGHFLAIFWKRDEQGRGD